ncbi:LysM peptidoglycan-binding domain-containing protein [Pollutibacter soli]|uniref:LysM peptidoglycan-binding domain-containing protein n=1 Tax=Pollutibacter soli TaxID=3034157 RepID=UPI0030137887
MALSDKYSELTSAAHAHGVSDLSVVEQNNVLYVTGTAPSEGVKKTLWDLYEKIDPGMKSADLVLNISVAAGSATTYEVKSGDNLSKIAKQYSGITWKDIFEANKDKIKDPDKIFPGQVLTIPV